MTEKGSMDVVSFGEILIDLVSRDEGSSFRRAAGGAPANVAVACSRLGLDSGFVGKVGNDGFGSFLNDTLRENEVNVSGLKVGEESTTLAFAWVDEEGERHFTFRRGADGLLSPEEVDERYIAGSEAFHFGSISMISHPARSATRKAIGVAEKNGLTITYDPNYRPDLWDREGEAKKQMKRGLEKADVAKFSAEEIKFLFGSPVEEGADMLLDYVDRAFISLGKGGCYYAEEGAKGYSDPYRVEVKDTTGAGDAFMGGTILGVLRDWKIGKTADFSNAAGALTTRELGVIPSLPTFKEVMTLFENRNLNE